MSKGFKAFLVFVFVLLASLFAAHVAVTEALPYVAKAVAKFGYALSVTEDGVMAAKAVAALIAGSVLLALRRKTAEAAQKAAKRRERAAAAKRAEQARLSRTAPVAHKAYGDAVAAAAKAKAAADKAVAAAEAKKAAYKAALVQRLQELASEAKAVKALAEEAKADAIVLKSGGRSKAAAEKVAVFKTHKDKLDALVGEINKLKVEMKALG